MISKYRWSESNYDLFVRKCVAITNLNIRMNHFRASDGEYDRRYVRWVQYIGSDVAKM